MQIKIKSTVPITQAVVPATLNMATKDGEAVTI